MKRTDEAARGGTWKCSHSMAFAKPYGAHKCVTCSHWLSLGPSNDEPDCVKVEMRAAELAAAWKGRREPFEVTLTAAEKSGCDKWPYLDPTSDELSGFLAVQIINHNAEQAGHTFTGQHRVHETALDLTAPLDAGEGGR